MSREAITAVILAGGRGTRLGGVDKGLLPLNGRPVVEYALGRIGPQVDRVLISANRNQDHYARYGAEVVADSGAPYQGPLAGIVTAMEHARTPYIVTVPCDAPFTPADLVERLQLGLEFDDAEIAVAHDGKRQQNLFSVQRTDLHGPLAEFLAGGPRSVQSWVESRRSAVVPFPDQSEDFMNLNSPDEWERAKKRLRR